MKTYEIKLLTPVGFKIEIYKDFSPLSQFEEKLVRKYGTFIMQSSKVIRNTEDIKAPLNYPCVILERKNTIGVNISEETLKNGFGLINNEKEFYQALQIYDDYVICHYYAVINKAIEIANSHQKLIFKKATFKTN